MTLWGGGEEIEGMKSRADCLLEQKESVKRVGQKKCDIRRHEGKTIRETGMLTLETSGASLLYWDGIINEEERRE